MTAMSEQIIEKVRNHPVLYVPGHADYKNVRVKNEIWDAIGLALNLEGEDVKKKWKNLRDSYAKHIKSDKAPPGRKSKTVDRYKSWPWADRMAFFKPYVKFFHTETTAIKVEPSANASAQWEEDYCALSPESVVIKDEDSFKVAPFNVNVPKRSDNAESSSEFYLENNEVNYKHLDDVDLIFMGYAKTVKKFSARRQTMIKYKFAKILMEEELLQHVEDQNDSSLT